MWVCSIGMVLAGVMKIRKEVNWISIALLAAGGVGQPLSLLAKMSAKKIGTQNHQEAFKGLDSVYATLASAASDATPWSVIEKDKVVGKNLDVEATYCRRIETALRQAGFTSEESERLANRVVHKWTY